MPTKLGDHPPPVVPPGDSPQAPGPAVLLLQETVAEVGLVVRATHRVQAGGGRRGGATHWGGELGPDKETMVDTAEATGTLST